MHWEELLGPMIPILYLLMLLVERFRPARVFPAVKGWVWIGVAFTALLIGINVALPLLFPANMPSLFHLGTLPEAVQVAIGFLVASFVDYLYHRSEHGFHFLWRWSHQIHHSALRMDISGAAYTSPVEISAAVLYSTASSLWLLGLTPESSAVVGFLMAFGSIFQHWNVHTPRWIGYALQRPESHCLHHEYGVHARNYSVFPLWDMLAGSFHNPEEFHGRVGFEEPAARRLWAMLAGRDVLSEATSSPLPQSSARPTETA